MKENLLKPCKKEDRFNSKSRSVLFFAIGFSALLTIIIIGYIKLSGMEDKVVEIIPVSNERQIKIQEQIQAKLPIQEDKMIPPPIGELKGRWFTTFGTSSIAEITIAANNQFELIYTSDPQGRARKYSKGSYKYDEKSGKITLYPSKKAGKPKAIKGVSYRILTMRHYDIFISKNPGEHDLYFTAPKHDIISKNFHPLFLYADYSGAPVLKFSPVQVGDKE